VAVLLDPAGRADGAVVAQDLDTRSKSERTARKIVRRAFSRRPARQADILFKKIDSTMRGHVAAELAAARSVLGRRPIVFTPAFPAQGRRVREAVLHLRGRPLSGDLRVLLAGAGFPATHVPAASAAGLRAALDAGARAFVCDASTDADLDRVARAGLALRPRPLFVGSAGLARALARALPRRRGAPVPRAEARPVLTVVGSASPVSRRQADALGARDLLVRIDWRRAPRVRDVPKVRRLGRLLARALPNVHYVLTGGVTARAVLAARGVRALRLLGEVEPGVPFGMAMDGTLVCTKAGAFGSAGTLARCVARLKREMRR
jgi:uncharacterized protein YgbK (DUF1537 family)